jgi:hypothetical protein
MADYNLEEDFPNLRESGWEKTSEPATEYNCVAWALYDTGQWWERMGRRIRGYFWPEDIARDDTIESWVRVFELHNYKTCDDRDVEPGFEKIAIYAKESEPTHVARQLETGAWTSKLGPDEDITHNTLEALEGECYGEAVVIMKRRRWVPTGSG